MRGRTDRQQKRELKSDTKKSQSTEIQRSGTAVLTCCQSVSVIFTSNDAAIDAAGNLPITMHSRASFEEADSTDAPKICKGCKATPMAELPQCPQHLNMLLICAKSKLSWVKPSVEVHGSDCTKF